MLRDRRCATCEWFAPFDNDNEAFTGQCRFDPPGEHGFPRVDGNKWCRQFALRQDLAIQKQQERERKRIGVWC